MTPEISQSLTITATGMLTVFIILALVVAMGSLLIKLVNSFATDTTNTKQDDLLVIEKAMNQIGIKVSKIERID